jgi:hypothetical protein
MKRVSSENKHFHEDEPRGIKAVDTVTKQIESEGKSEKPMYISARDLIPCFS